MLEYIKTYRLNGTTPTYLYCNSITSTLVGALSIGHNSIYIDNSDTPKSTNC